MFTTSILAPPCNGPAKAEIPADTESKRFALEEPTMRTVEVEQFCSWSAWSIKNRFKASTVVSEAR